MYSGILSVVVVLSPLFLHVQSIISSVQIYNRYIIRLPYKFMLREFCFLGAMRKHREMYLSGLRGVPVACNHGQTGLRSKSDRRARAEPGIFDKVCEIIRPTAR